MTDETKRRIVLLLGHPDPRPERLGNALAQTYAEAAQQAGHTVRRIEIGKLDFPFLRSKEEWTSGSLPDGLRTAQETIQWSEHVALFFPLWMGTMPALVKAFLEQVLRPGFAVQTDERRQWQRALAGRSARVVVTMGMPASLYRWYFLAHGVRGLERNVLATCGLKPVRQTLIGMVDGGSRRRHDRHFRTMRELGRRAI